MKRRVDLLLLERGIAKSREQARAMVMSGDVYTDGRRVDKPGDTVEEEAPVEWRGERLRYVSRGGLKLQKAVETFGVDLGGAVAADIGASTGGFTDCMLQNGAKKVYAVDVGYGQLAWNLRNDPRVVTLERQNARYLTADEIPEPLDFFSADVSFISLRLILPALFGLCRASATAVCLIKPQFEAGKGRVGKNGVVRDPAIHAEVIRDILGFAAASGAGVLGLTYSPVKGPKGNIEFLVYLQHQSDAGRQADIDAVVAEAHAAL